MNEQISLQGQYRDGVGARQVAVEIRLDGQQLVISSIDNALEIARVDCSRLKWIEPVGLIPSRLELPQHQSIVTVEHEAFQDMKAQCQRRQRKWSGKLQLLERSNAAAFLGVAVLFLSVGFFIWQGIPAISRYVAFELPQSVLDRASEETLWLIKRHAAPSELSEARQEALQQYFARYALTEKEAVTFLKMNVPNAFALPNGKIVFTDGLVELANDDEELLAIYLHEQGHVQLRHGLIYVVESFIWSLMLSYLLDGSSIADFVTSVPVSLTFAAYSRDFEREADDYAKRQMQRHQIPLHRFADIMRSLQEYEPEFDSVPLEKMETYLSTHPRTEERIQAFESVHER